ncbi:MAG: TetR/AcrR family transcriptional regulator [Polyangiaceae bacterium]|nr:TetR/AcrR family transcriptional regulator [Myxococcales bacterium]MCB9584319.1 TetR/AcrR family transcriptional regulator [Polyangiaceae bacterium]
MSVLEKPDLDADAPRSSKAKKRTYKSAEARRQQILQCALEAFSERGYHATSIGEICERARIGRATLYQYFTDKRDVLVALLEGIYSKVVQAVEDRQRLSLERALSEARGSDTSVHRVGSSGMPTHEQSIAFMRARFIAFLSLVFEDEATTRLILRAARGADGVVDELLGRLDAVVIESIEQELRLAIAAGIVRDLDVPFVARFFVGGLEKVVLRAIDEERPLDIEQIAEQAALLEGIGILTAT